MGGSGNKSPIKQKATNARDIENMNEAQLNKEIAKAERSIARANKIMGINDITANTAAKARQETFPLGVGGDGWSDARKKANTKSIQSDVNKAVKYDDAYNAKKSAETRLKALQNAKKQVAGTGKTQKQIKEERLKNTKSTMTWKKEKSPNGWTVSKSGDFSISHLDGTYGIEHKGKNIGFVNTLKKAKSIAEIMQKRLGG